MDPKKPNRVKFDLRQDPKFLENFLRNFRVIVKESIDFNGSSSFNFDSYGLKIRLIGNSVQFLIRWTQKTEKCKI